MTVAVDVLGPLRVRVGTDERPVGGRRERVLLALLSTTPGRHVGDDRIIDELWGDDPPAGATSAVQVAVSRLRRALGERRRGTPRRRRLRPRGRRGRRRPCSSAAADRVGGSTRQRRWRPTDAALGLWRGEPYVGLGAAPDPRRRGDPARGGAAGPGGGPRPGAAGPRPARGGPPHAGPARGRPIPSASGCGRSWRSRSTAATDRPTPSRRCGLLRAALVEELGVDPSASVRELEQRVLAQDPALDGPAPTRPTAPARGPTGGGDRHRARACSGVVGRAAALSAIHDALGRPRRRRPGRRPADQRRRGDRQVHARHRGRPPRPRRGRPGASSAAVTRPTWRRRTGPGCPCCATSRPPGPRRARRGHRPARGRGRRQPAPEAAGAAATTLRTFAAVARLLAAQPGRWSC